MAIKFKGKEPDSFFYKGKEVVSIFLKGKEIHSAGNFVTADGYVILTSDGYVFNAKKR